MTMMIKRRKSSGKCTVKRRRAWPFVFVSMVLIGCGSTSKTNADDPASAPHVAVVKVARGKVLDTLEIASEFQPFQEIDVYAKVSGYIQKLNVDWGLHVSQGQLLVVLEFPEIDTL